MNPEIKEIPREDLITKANEIGIEEPHMMSSEELLNALNSYEENAYHTKFAEYLTD